MTLYAGQDLLVKIANDAEPVAFVILGMARTTAVDVTNDLADAAVLGSSGTAAYVGAAGRRNMRIALQGMFRDSAAEAVLCAAALMAASRGYMLVFPNGDTYEADFIVESYRREGSQDGLDMFTVSLIRTGDGLWTQA